MRRVPQAQDFNPDGTLKFQPKSKLVLKIDQMGDGDDSAGGDHGRHDDEDNSYADDLSEEEEESSAGEEDEEDEEESAQEDEEAVEEEAEELGKAGVHRGEDHGKRPQVIEGKKGKSRRTIVNVYCTEYDVVPKCAKKVFNCRLKYIKEDHEGAVNSNGDGGLKLSTEWDLTWHDLSISADFLSKMAPYQKVNQYPGIYVISRKHNLARNLLKMQKAYPEEYDFFPRTWILPLETNDFRKQFVGQDGRPLKKKKTYIIKPDGLSQGQGIYLSRNCEKIIKQCTADGGHIVQQYLDKPHLVDDLKYDLRIYVLVYGLNPLRVYLHEQGIARFATEPYVAPKPHNIDNLFMHLTNYAINKNNSAFMQNSGAGFESEDEEEGESEEESGHKRSLHAIMKILMAEGGDPDLIMERIKDIVVKTIIVGQPYMAHIYRSCQPDDYDNSMCFQILGFDIMIDKHFRPWLIEVNQSPSFGTDSAFDYDVKKNVISDAFRLLNLSQEKRVELVKERQRQMKERIFTGKQEKLDPVKKHEIRQERLRKRFDFENKQVRCGSDNSYELLFPSLFDEEKNQKYEQLLQKANDNWDEFTCGPRGKKKVSAEMEEQSKKAEMAARKLQRQKEKKFQSRATKRKGASAMPKEGDPAKKTIGSIPVKEEGCCGDDIEAYETTGATKKTDNLKEERQTEVPKSDQVAEKLPRVDLQTERQLKDIKEINDDLNEQIDRLFDIKKQSVPNPLNVKSDQQIFVSKQKIRTIMQHSRDAKLEYQSEATAFGSITNSSQKFTEKVMNMGSEKRVVTGPRQVSAVQARRLRTQPYPIIQSQVQPLLQFQQLPLQPQPSPSPKNHLQTFAGKIDARQQQLTEFMRNHQQHNGQMNVLMGPQKQMSSDTGMAKANRSRVDGLIRSQNFGQAVAGFVESEAQHQYPLMTSSLATPTKRPHKFNQSDIGKLMEYKTKQQKLHQQYSQNSNLIAAASKNHNSQLFGQQHPQQQYNTSGPVFSSQVIQPMHTVNGSNIIDPNSKESTTNRVVVISGQAGVPIPEKANTLLMQYSQQVIAPPSQILRNPQHQQQHRLQKSLVPMDTPHIQKTPQQQYRVIPRFQQNSTTQRIGPGTIAGSRNSTGVKTLGSQASHSSYQQRQMNYLRGKMAEQREVQSQIQQHQAIQDRGKYISNQQYRINEQYPVYHGKEKAVHGTVGHGRVTGNQEWIGSQYEVQALQQNAQPPQFQEGATKHKTYFNQVVMMQKSPPPQPSCKNGFNNFGQSTNPKVATFVTMHHNPNSAHATPTIGKGTKKSVGTFPSRQGKVSQSKIKGRARQLKNPAV